MIATFANSLRPRAIAEKLDVPFSAFTISDKVLPWINLIVIIAAIYITYKVFSNSTFARRLTNILRNRIIKKEMIKSVSCEELAVATGGYGVSRIKIREDNPILGKALSESELRKDDITVLAIVRAERTMPNPVADTKILLGDELICFGKLGIIRKKLA
jgi:uncharacterized protein with PhoU and TrkA domain